MDTEIIIALVSAVLASPVIVKIWEFIAKKINKKETQLDRIEKDANDIKVQISKIKLDQMRTNLMVLIADYPNSADIPGLAEAYVKKYNGDSYVIPLIVEWYHNRGLELPEWLKKAHSEHCTYEIDEEK